MKEQYEHNVTFHSVLRSEKPSRDEGNYSGASAACGRGPHPAHLSALPRRRPGTARTNVTFNWRCAFLGVSIIRVQESLVLHFSLNCFLFLCFSTTFLNDFYFLQAFKRHGTVISQLYRTTVRALYPVQMYSLSSLFLQENPLRQMSNVLALAHATFWMFFSASQSDTSNKHS